MENFRQFDAGPDPFGRTWKVEFKWLQTAISLRHSDTVDVKFVVHDESTRVEKTIALPHADLLALTQKACRAASATPHRDGRGYGKGSGDGIA